MAFNQRIGKATLELSIEGGSFIRGAADAKATMRDLARGIAETQRDIQKQAFTFSGRNQIAEASKLVEAIKRVGGVDRLTAAERIQVNSQLSSALEKARLTQARVSAEMETYEKATRKAGGATEWMSAKMTALGAFAGTLAANLAQKAVSALVSMGQEAFNSAGRILDLANTTGLSTKTIQQMQYAADTTSSSLEGFTNAAFQLGLRVASNSKEVNEAIERLQKYGVETEKLRAAKPDEQWNMVTRALERVGSTQERNIIGNALMGKTYKDVSSSIVQGYHQIADQAKVATDSQLRELEKLSNEWERFKRNLTTGFGAAMGRVALETRIRSEVVDEYFRRRRDEPGFKGFPADDSTEVKSAADYKPRFLNVEEEAQRRLQLELFDARTKDVQLTMEQARAQDYYRSRLKQVNEELRKLKPADRAELDAALKLGAEDLAELESRFHLTSGALRVYQADIKDATRETNKFNELLQKFNAGPAAKKEALDLAEAMTPDPKTGKAILDLSRMAEEDQRKVGKALLDGVRAWQVAKEEVPRSVAAQLAAVLQLRMMPDLVKEIADDTKMGLGAFAGQGLDTLGAEDAVNEQSARNVAERIEARKSAARIVRDTDLAAAEFGIAEAKRWGANWQDVYRMEAQLSRRRLDAAIADSDAEFTERIREMRTSGEIEASTMAAMEAEHKAHVDQMVEDWRQGEIAKREELQITHDIWQQLRRQAEAEQADFARNIASEILGIRQEVTGHLFSTLFSGGDDSAKKAAKAAREDYQRIAKSGKASAEEITRAFRAMTQANEAAHSRWADRFKSIWDGVKRHLFNIFDQILEHFVDQFLNGMLQAFMQSGIGQRLMGILGNLGGLLAGGGRTSGGGTSAGGGGVGVGVTFGGQPGVGVGVGFGGPFQGSFPQPTLFRPWGSGNLPAPSQIQLGPTGGGGSTVPRLNGYRSGGLTPPGVTELAMLHGGRRGELHIPLDSFSNRAIASLDRALAMPMPTREAAAAGLPQLQARNDSRALPSIINNTWHLHVETPDAEGFDRIWDEKLVPRMKRDMALNRNDLGYTVRRAVAP